MKWYRSRTTKCKPHHRATSCVESGDGKPLRSTSQCDASQLSRQSTLGVDGLHCSASLAAFLSLIHI
eukprot:404895-Prymnesium_polylepis.1